MVKEPDLSSNFLTHVADLRSRPYLTYLNIASNRLTVLPTLSANLEKIVASENLLSSSFQEQLGKVADSANSTGSYNSSKAMSSKLTFMDLSKNQITGSLPKLVTTYSS